MMISLIFTFKGQHDDGVTFCTICIKYRQGLGSKMSAFAGHVRVFGHMLRCLRCLQWAALKNALSYTLSSRPTCAGVCHRCLLHAQLLLEAKVKVAIWRLRARCLGPSCIGIVPPCLGQHADEMLHGPKRTLHAEPPPSRRTPRLRPLKSITTMQPVP